MSANTAIEQFVQALVPAAGKVFSERPPAAWTVKLDDPQTPFAAGTQLMTLLLVSEPSKGEAAIQINLDNTLALAAVLAGMPAPPAQLKPEHAQAVRAAFAKACEAAAQALQIQVQVQPSKALTWTPAKQFSMTATDGAKGRIQFQVAFTPDWPKAGQASGAATAARPSAAKGMNVAMLEGVELDVTLRFGQRQLSLQEIGELRSGSVVELDRLVQDPAELLLGDRVIAKGEVVIVDGNYGLRVTEVM